MYWAHLFPNEVSHASAPEIGGRLLPSGAILHVNPAATAVSTANSIPTVPYWPPPLLSHSVDGSLIPHPGSYLSHYAGGYPFWRFGDVQRHMPPTADIPSTLESAGHSKSGAHPDQQFVSGYKRKRSGDVTEAMKPDGGAPMTYDTAAAAPQNVALKPVAGPTSAANRTKSKEGEDPSPSAPPLFQVSRYRGVSAARSGHWRVQVGFRKKRLNVGHFPTEEEENAARTYDCVVRLLHGRPGMLNFPDEIITIQSLPRYFSKAATKALQSAVECGWKPPPDLEGILAVKPG